MTNYQLNNITLHTLNPKAATGVLLAGSRHLPCALGKSGIASRKYEGDGATPRGRMSLLRVYYRPDRLRPPKTGLPALPLNPQMGWCDDPRDPNYNRPVPWPYTASAEQLWRQDHIYDLIVILGFNHFPCKKGSGSAIFWHLARPDFSATAGCIAIKKREMIKLLEYCNRATRLIIP